MSAEAEASAKAKAAEGTGEVADRGRAVREHWFGKLPDQKRDEIIQPAFEKAHPTHDAKREATRKFDMGE